MDLFKPVRLHVSTVYSQGIYVIAWKLKLSTWLIRVRFVVTKDTITRLLTVWELGIS